MTAPQPSGKRARALAQRQKYLIQKAEEEAAAEVAARASMAEALASSQKRLDERKTMIAEYTKQAGEYSKVPVRLGNLMGPEGNVWNVIGACRGGIRYAKEHSIPVLAGAEAVVTEFTKRTYDETLKEILRFYDDLDGSIAAYYQEEAVRGTAEEGPPRFGDNPLGSLIGK
jgi:hypothetical protein